MTKKSLSEAFHSKVFMVNLMKTGLVT